MPPEDSLHDAVVNRFLLELIDDRAAGRERPLPEYQARFPGFEDAIAGEYRRQRGATPPAPAAFLAEGQVIGSYRLVAEIGRGGQGSVWRALDARTGRTVALKILHGEHAWTEAALARFRREVAIACKLDHPGICAVYEADTQGGLPYVAMQLLDGETLAERIQRHKREQTRPDPLDVAGRIELAARALHAAHAAGVVHRDVKPGNLITTRAERVVLLDFGLAREVEGATLTRTGDVFGTPAYMAPEQIEGRACSASTDVWALGVTLYEALTLEQPFHAPTREALYRAILAEEAPDPRALDRRVPRDLAVVVATALAKEPERRYASALDLAEDLRAFQEGRPIAARPIGLAGRAWRWARREPRRAALSAALLAAVLLLAATSGYLVARRGELEAGKRALAEAELQRLIRDVSGGFARDAARESLDEMLAEDPDLVPQRATLAMHLGRRERFDEAWRILDATPPGQASDARLARAKTMVLLYSDRLAEADALDRELGLPRTELEAHIASMFAELRAGPAAPERAFEHALRAVLLVPGMNEAFLERFLFTAFQSGRREESALAAEILVARWPDSATAWFYAATPWSAFDEARSRAALEKAVELDPELGLAHATRSYYAMVDGEFERADELFERAFALFPPGSREQRGLLQVRALECLHFDREDAALASVERAIDVAGADAELLLLRARALRELGRNAEADETLGQVLELDPENAEAHELLGF